MAGSDELASAIHTELGGAFGVDKSTFVTPTTYTETQVWLGIVG